MKITEEIERNLTSKLFKPVELKTWKAEDPEKETAFGRAFRVRWACRFDRLEHDGYEVALNLPDTYYQEVIGFNDPRSEEEQTSWFLWMAGHYSNGLSQRAERKIFLYSTVIL